MDKKNRARVPKISSIGSKLQNRLIVSAALAIGMACVDPAAVASENGGFGPYGIGAETLGSGFLPPAGETMTYGYLLNYSAGKFAGGNGQPIIPGFDLNVMAEATMTRHTWGFSYAGFNFGSALIQEAVRVSVRAAGSSDNNAGFSFINVQPLAVSRAIGDWHFLTATHLLIPVGHYDPAALANSTNNYFTITQEFSATWTPSPRWMVDVSTNLSFNDRNKATDYESGDMFGVTWGANYRPFPAALNWQLGVNGLYLTQLEDDRVHHAKVGDGFRIRKVSAGPQIGYWFSPQFAVVAKWQKEFDVRNAPKGDAIWLQAAFPM